MKDFNPETLLAIAEEILGTWFWPVLVLVCAVIVLNGLALFRHRTGGRSACIAGAVAGLAAALLVLLGLLPWTDSGFRDLNGFVDVAVLAGAAGAAALAGGLTVWPMAALLSGDRRRPRP